MNQTNRDGTLFVVGTPIGNLEDITLRALRILGEVSVIAAEDTRVTAKLCRRHEIGTPLVSFREQNAHHMIPKLLERLEAGEDIALVTDAGTPSVSDPGIDLVSAVEAAGFRIVPIPGASALASAISVAGLQGDGVRFFGFLPRSGRRRRERIQAIAAESALVVIYEAPGRLTKTLLDLNEACGPRQAAVMRELTKIHEEIVRDTLDNLCRHFSETTKGEITLVVEGNTDRPQEDISEDQLRQLIRKELAKGRSVKDIAASLAQGLGLPRKRIYELGLELNRS